MQGVLAQAPPTAPRPSGVVLSDGDPHGAAQIVTDVTGAPGARPPAGDAAPVEPPSWMLDAPARSQVTIRTGASPMRGNGLGTFGFFAMIVVVVGLAGTIGVLFWGPDKTSSTRTHLATDPSAPTTTLPSLADSASAPPAASVALAGPADSAAADSAPAANVSASAKKAKKTRAKKR